MEEEEEVREVVGLGALTRTMKARGYSLPFLRWSVHCKPERGNEEGTR